MRFLKQLFNPLMAFIGIQLAWVLVVLVWLDWFLGQHRRLRELAEKYSPELLLSGPDWVIMVEGLLLLVAILVGVYVIFVYWTRQAALIREQKQFMSQVTHELKSPLASLQLHLETIRRQDPSREELLVFLDTMQGDANRLNGLIDNLLSASRIEQKHWKLNLQETNFSALVEKYFHARQFDLPRAGKMRLQIVPNLYAMLDKEAMETVFRNLLENAVLYSDGTPEIIVSLDLRGDKCHFTLSDRGRGLEEQHLKKVFKVFYRVRRKNENIRGSGLGLFIVKATVKRHHGKVAVESPGPGQGTAVHIFLPSIARRDE
jgi:signal transduction histidine kinase